MTADSSLALPRASANSSRKSSSDTWAGPNKKSFSIVACTQCGCLSVCSRKKSLIVITCSKCSRARFLSSVSSSAENVSGLSWSLSLSQATSRVDSSAGGMGKDQSSIAGATRRTSSIVVSPRATFSAPACRRGIIPPDFAASRISEILWWAVMWLCKASSATRTS